MPTGACGINCDVCKLFADGICSSCGSGTGREGFEKAEAQKKLFGQPCPILGCAQMNRIAYCTLDCDQFPCENFEAGPYPFSTNFLEMQKRRRTQPLDEKESEFTAPPEFWDDLQKRDIAELCNLSLAIPGDAGGLRLKFLNEEVVVDVANRCILRLRGGKWEKKGNGLFELVVLVYLLSVTYEGVSNKIVGLQELREAHFFQGPHVLRTDELLAKYGRDPDGFRAAAESLGGQPLDMADAAYKLTVFPKIPLYYLLWEGDDEFAPNLSVLFDRSVDEHLSADAIWGTVNLVSQILVSGWQGI